jgi:hypothetical protein
VSSDADAPAGRPRRGRLFALDAWADGPLLRSELARPAITSNVGGGSQVRQPSGTVAPTPPMQLVNSVGAGLGPGFGERRDYSGPGWRPAMTHPPAGRIFTGSRGR